MQLHAENVWIAEARAKVKTKIAEDEIESTTALNTF